MNRFLLASIFLSSAAALQAAAPAWTTGNDPRYPETKYVIGMGVGPDIDTARANARAEVSRAFHARVQQVMNEVQSETSQTLGKKRGPAQGRQSSTVNTSISTEGILEGVVIKETWFDRSKNTQYALALLDKSIARRGYAQKILPLEQTITAQRSAAGQSQDPVAQLRALSKARAAAVERDVLVAKRRVVDPTAPADLGSASAGQIEAEIAGALARVRVSIDAGESVTLRQKIAARVSPLGIMVVDAPATTYQPGSDPVLRVRAWLNVQPVDRGDPQWKYYQWNGSVELVTGQGMAVATGAPFGSESHPVDATAKSKAQQAGEDALAQEAERVVSNYVFGQ